MRKYGESKTTRIMMATVPHVTSGSGLRKFQADDGFLLDRVYIYTRLHDVISQKLLILLIMYVLTISSCTAPQADVDHGLTFSGFLKCLPKLHNTDVAEMKLRHERFSNTHHNQRHDGQNLRRGFIHFTNSICFLFKAHVITFTPLCPVLQNVLGRGYIYIYTYIYIRFLISFLPQASKGLQKDQYLPQIFKLEAFSVLLYALFIARKEKEV